MVEIAQNLFSTRRGSLIVGGGAALLAGLVLLVYLHNYRNSLRDSSVKAPVLVAKNLIPKGTPGDIIASTGQFQVSDLPKDQFKDGAITDPATLAGRVALTDIYPRQQLSAAEFSATPVDTLSVHITGVERAISVPIGAANGVNGQLAQGDHIDVFVGISAEQNGVARPIIKHVMKDIEVLRPPVGGITTLRTTAQQAAELAWAADNGHLWFVLRPPSGALTPKIPMVDTSLILNLKPVR